MELIILFILMVIDYLLTMYGLSTNFIQEGNTLMNWLVNCPLWLGLLIKIIMSVLLLVPFYLVKKINHKLYKISVKFLLIVYSVIMILHAVWIAMYLWA